jgi:hypothetical protein
MRYDPETDLLPCEDLHDDDVVVGGADELPDDFDTYEDLRAFAEPDDVDDVEDDRWSDWEDWDD